MKVSRENINVHVIFALGVNYSKISIEPSSVEVSPGKTVIHLNFPWVNEPEVNAMTIIQSEQGARAVGREIAVSTGWFDEPMLVLHLNARFDQVAPSLKNIIDALNQVSASSELWGQVASYQLYALNLDGKKDYTSNSLREIASDVGGEYRGEIAIEKDSLLYSDILQNVAMGSLIDNVLEKIKELGFCISNIDIARDNILGKIYALKSKGLSINAQDVTSRNELSRIIARDYVKE